MSEESFPGVDLAAPSLGQPILITAEGELDIEQVREIVELRATLEGLNARLAAMRRDKAQMTELQAILDEGKRLADGGDPVELARLNEGFHGALADMADNPLLRDIVKSLRERTALLFAPLNRNRGKQNWDEHAAIMRAVIAGDGELACFLSLLHVYSAANMQPRS